MKTSKDKKINKNKIVPIACLVYVVIGMFICVVINTNKNFYSVTVTDFIEAYASIGSLLSVLLISYYLTEEKEDSRILKEKMNDKIEFTVSSVNLFSVEFFSDDFKSSDFTLLKKKIDRSINLLKHYSDRFDYNEESEKLSEKFDLI